MEFGFSKTQRSSNRGQKELFLEGQYLQLWFPIEAQFERDRQRTRPRRRRTGLLREASECQMAVLSEE